MIRTEFNDTIETKTREFSFSVDTVIHFTNYNRSIVILSDFFDPFCFFTTSPKITNEKGSKEFNLFYSSDTLNRYQTFIFLNNDTISFWCFKKSNADFFIKHVNILKLTYYLINNKYIPGASAVKFDNVAFTSQPFAMIKDKLSSKNYDEILPLKFATLSNRNIFINNIFNSNADEYALTQDDNDKLTFNFSKKYGIITSHFDRGASAGAKRGFFYDLNLEKVQNQ